MTPREQTGRLRTVTGTIAASDVTGPVLSHEHLRMDLRWPARPRLAEADPYRWLDEEKAVTRELSDLRAGAGLGLVVDLSCSGMGRDAAALARISAGARVAVVAGTGVFTEPFHPDYVRTALDAGEALGVERIAERLLAEIGFGLDGTNSLPGVIGEIGTWGEAPSEAEEACLRAAAQAARYSGLSVATYGRAGVAQLEILTAAGLAPDRVAVGQQDRVDDPGQHRKIAETGAYVSFGTLGLAGEDHAAIGARVRGVMDLLEAGHADRVLLSTGVARMDQVARNGGVGYGYLFEVFLPALRAAGADDATLDAVLRDNPLRWLTAGSAAS
ncbi:phosphotriesterase family protein [Actinomadura terrae]|uniref:phosphotriesterase family protein n=1 Tax=Actinomadura terrae TaxID=604353 RepID=UPI001FA6B3CD|nr:aryldialkylphosphatase [Actinomadura terrae]